MSLQAQLLSERHMQSLLMEVWQYYFGERLYYLLILKHILSHWQDEADPYKEIYEKFLDKINKDKAVLHKIINQIEVSISTELPSKDTNGPYMTDLLAYHWVTFILKEQYELLQLLLLYYKVIEPTISDVQKLLSVFQTHGFGLRQSFRFMFSDENQHLVDLIGLGEHYLLKDEKALLELNNSIHNLGSHQSHSPVLLCWLLISQCSEVPVMVKSAYKLGKSALQLDVFEYLKTAVSSPEFSRKGVIPDIINLIVYNLLSIVLSQFELHNLGSVQPLYAIATSVLKCKSVADDFWEQEEKSGIRELFTYCIEMFSIEFCPLLNMCSSLASTEKESCIKVVQTINKLPVFTEFLENIDERDVTATQEPNVWELIKDRTLYGDHSITLPKGTLGIVIKETDKDSSSVIQWQVDVNGWQICLRELYFKLQEMSFSSALIPVESIKRMITVGKLVKNILETAPEMRFQLSHILNAMFSILQRHISSTSPSLELISVCIDIAAILSRDEVSDVWQQLSQIRLLPFMTSVPKNIMDRVSGICMNIGIIGQLIASRECISGEYSVCLAFLNLVLNVSENAASENENFLACVVYIMREIFSYFHKWYYSEPNQRLLMGQICLQLLHNLFPMNKHKTKSFELGEQVASMIRLSLSVLNRLLLLRNNFCVKSSKTEVSPLEAVLFSTPGHTTQPQVVLMVAHYAFQRYNPHLAILAIQLLKRFAKEFPMSLLACFGSEAEAIRDHFLARLCFQYENVRLKVAILEFLTVCIAQQPGLIEMFI
ncbi:nucleoporin NUP188-like [Uloborus diversus]|uniref:nucleoporin NUP188-like n=1 Tax=Uloborus diversus TaxID=327109 RepID=UPI00240971E7|nr:nucleoporin NUP188-like [Uloborus diversus]